MIHRGRAVKVAEGHVGDKDRVNAELKGALLTSTWMAGSVVMPPESSRGRNK